MRGERGSVLLQVLVVAAVAGVICAAILRARLQPAMAAAGAVNAVTDDLSAQSAINRVNEVWIRNGSCSSDPAVGVSCSGSGCSCTCAVAGAAAVTSVPYGGACSLTASNPRGTIQ